MRRIKLTVAYDGTNYHGWQFQPGNSTIEGELNKHLSELFKEEIAVIGASRTDSGVQNSHTKALYDMMELCGIAIYSADHITRFYIGQHARLHTQYFSVTSDTNVVNVFVMYFLPQY